MLKIGEFARLAQVSVKQLRRYHCEAVLLADELRAPPKGVQRVELPPCTLATVLHTEAEADAASAYRAVMEYATVLGYRRAGPMREIYLGRALIEAQFPLQAITEPS